MHKSFTQRESSDNTSEENRTGLLPFNKQIVGWSMKGEAEPSQKDVNNKVVFTQFFQTFLKKSHIKQSYQLSLMARLGFI